MNQNKCDFVLFAILFVVLTAENTLAVGYRFTNIADTTTAAPSGSFSGFANSEINGAAISGSTVAFVGFYGDTQQRHGIFTGGGGAITTIVQQGDPAPVGTFHSVGGSFGISGDTVAFGAFYNNAAGAGIFTGSGGPLTTIAKPGDPWDGGSYIQVVPEAAISGNNVTFYGVVTDGTTGQFGNIKSNGSTQLFIAENQSHGNPPFVELGMRPAISGERVATLIDDNYPSPTGPVALITGSGGPLTTIVTSGDAAPTGTFDGFTYDPVISGDTVAFLGYYGSETGIFAGCGGPLTTIAKDGDPAPIGTFNSNSFAPNGFSISGNTTAFLASFGIGSNTDTGIFVGDGGPATAVIKTGDPLLGSTVTGLAFGRFALDPDGSGNLAFYYGLANGRQGIALATPFVPQPMGDFNENGTVDAADYVVWRDGLGNGYTQLDYSVWRTHFGKSTGNGTSANANAAVPEPSTLLMLVAGMLTMRFRQRASASKRMHA